MDKKIYAVVFLMMQPLFLMFSIKSLRYMGSGNDGLHILIYMLFCNVIFLILCVAYKSLQRNSE